MATRDESTQVYSPEQLQRLLRKAGSDLATPAEESDNSSAANSTANAPSRFNAAFERHTLEDVRALFPDYAIDYGLGEGGFASVWHAVDRRGRQHALKLLKPGVSDDVRFMERFRREADALSTLRLPNLVHAEPKFGDALDEPWMLLEYVPGGTVQRDLSRGAYSRKLALQVARDMANVLTTVHVWGVVHRDIKPANILLAADGTPKLADFGFLGLLRPTTREATLTNTNEAIGTPSYMAPEQREGRVSAVTIDIYQVGVLLREMLSGEPPGPKGYEDPPNTGDARIDELIEHLCAHDPADRPQTMEEVVARLDELMG